MGEGPGGGGRGHRVGSSRAAMPIPWHSPTLGCYHFILPPTSSFLFLAQLVLCRSGYKISFPLFPDLPLTLIITKFDYARQPLPSPACGAGILLK